MRRRGVGVDAVHLKRRQEAAFAKVGAALEEDQMGHITNLLGELKSSLENFARKHRKAINSDPAFRMQFQAMCENIGWVAYAASSGFWSKPTFSAPSLRFSPALPHAEWTHSPPTKGFGPRFWV
jgi:ESCRT-II complex subunit VPS22